MFNTDFGIVQTHGVSIAARSDSMLDDEIKDALNKFLINQDWGEIGNFDWQQNNKIHQEGYLPGDQALGVYPTRNHGPLWVIRNDNIVTVLWPSDY